MPRHLLQDMVRVKKTPANIKDKKNEKEIKEISNRIKIKNKGPRYRIYFVALISVIFLLFALSFLFSGAKITLFPKVKDIPLNDNLSAEKNSNTGPSFDLVIISGEENKTIQSNKVKDVAIKATGAVVIYNAFSSSPQTLDINTRLEGSNGKIYKTVKKIIVPGINKNGNPGSMKVDIYGENAGEEYNSAPIDFKIFGFKGTPKYSGFYARSEGDITQGLKGKSPVISSLDKTTSVSELKAVLEAKLLSKIKDQIPNGFILFKDAIVTNINDKDITFTPDKDNAIKVSVKGTLYGFLLDEKKLSAKIAQDVVDNYDKSEVYIPNIKDLTFSLSNKESISFANANSINFTLSGTARIVWKIDKSKLIADILGKKKSDFNQILSLYPNIATAQLVIRPFWKTTFPDKSKNIQVIINYPK